MSLISLFSQLKIYYFEPWFLADSCCRDNDENRQNSNKFWNRNTGSLEMMSTVPLNNELFVCFSWKFIFSIYFCCNIFLLKFTWEYISAEILKYEDCTIYISNFKLCFSKRWKDSWNYSHWKISPRIWNFTSALAQPYVFFFHRLGLILYIKILKGL